MATEIERKFLVSGHSYRPLAYNSRRITQAYLSCSADATVRLRIIDNIAFITIKSRTSGCCRGEWEYQIPTSDANDIISACNLNDIISKTRYYINFDNHIWEIDEFHGRLNGLVVAEIELSSPNEQFALPQFIDREVTSDPRFFNSNLSTVSDINSLLCTNPNTSSADIQ